jgi:transcription antitermination protein NusB
MGNRRKARECALQILFQLEFNTADPSALAKDYWRHQRVTPGTRDFGTWLVERILAHRDEIDEAVQSASRNWRLDRMAVVDRNILRIAVCELLYEPTLVPAIVINEAIEIAKKYSGQESSVFVNGVLDAVGKRLAGPAGKPGGRTAGERGPS